MKCLYSHFDECDPCHKCFLTCCDTYFFEKNKDEIISLILASQSIFSENLTSLHNFSKKVPLVTHDFFSIFEIYRLITPIVEHFKEI